MKPHAGRNAGRPPVSVGHIDLTSAEYIADTIKLRVMSQRTPIVAFIDAGEVYAVRADSTAARHLPDDPDMLLGLYTRGAERDAILADVLEMQEGRRMGRAA